VPRHRPDWVGADTGCLTVGFHLVSDQKARGTEVDFVSGVMAG